MWKTHGFPRKINYYKILILRIYKIKSTSLDDSPSCPNHSTASEAVPFRQAQGREQIGWGRALDVLRGQCEELSETRYIYGIIYGILVYQAQKG